jgi:UDP-N-acetylglucosamine 2-epimerase (non-hydrolysing)
MPGNAALLASPRVGVLAHSALPDLVSLISVSTLGVTDRYGAGREALDFGLPTVLVERAGRPSLVPGTVVADPAAVLTRMAQLLAEHPRGRRQHADPAAAGRAEHALAWMFGIEARPVPGPTGQPSTAPGAEE